MKAFFGLSDSLAGVAENPAKCPHCQTTTRLGRGLCVNCLLNAGLDQNRVDAGIESLDALLDAVNVPDRQWRLGNYEILEEVGRGGMGVIYRARQRHSRRIVAVKRVLSYHADSRETLERFRREAEAAASLDHPNILPIYEVSESEEGLPYFSMKFATGGSLQDVAQSLRGDPRSCVGIVAKVARATACAHGQGILHRDLKPGNILLDGRGEPLVSDFGLAKWLDTTSDLTRTLTTFGTPGYIAPEQAEGHSADLTAAADVYSLGAILFDLLTGRPPFIGEHALSVIRQAAEKPAPRLRSLEPSLDRDLETICARCLEREPRTRYHSAQDLAIDLERWLEGKPIKARRALPPTRVWRWSRRNPVLVGTASVCLFLGAASILLLRHPAPPGQNSSAIKRPSLSPEEAAEQAKLRHALLQYVDADEEVHLSHLGWTNSSKASIEERLYSDLAARVGLETKLLQDKLPTFANAVKRDPDAALSERASAAFFTKDYPEAERLALRRAAEASQAGEAAHAVEAIDGLMLAAASACKASDDCARAMDHLREAEKLTNRERDPAKWADVQYAIADVYDALYQWPQAEKAFHNSMDVRTRLYGSEHPQTLRARRARACVLLQMERDSEAEAEYRELLKINERTLGPEHPETLWSRWDVAEAISGDYAGKLQDALVEFRELLKLRLKVLGPEHPDTLRTRAAIANTLSSLGQYDEAIAQKRELMNLQEKVLGPEDGYTIKTIANLGGDLANTGAFPEAEAMLRKAIQLRQRILGAADFSTLECREDLARILSLQTRDSEAEMEVRDVLKIKDASVGVERSGWTHDLLGIILERQRRYAEAEAQFRQSLRMNEKSIGADSSAALVSRGNLARNLYYQERISEAEAQLRELIALSEKVLGRKTYSRTNNYRVRINDDVTPLLARMLLANLLRDQRRFAEGEVEYKNLIDLFEDALGPEDQDTLDAYYNYAYQLAEQGKQNEARLLAERAAKGADKLLGATDPSTRKYTAFAAALQANRPILVTESKFRDSLLVPNSAAEQPAH